MRLLSSQIKASAGVYISESGSGTYFTGFYLKQRIYRIIFIVLKIQPESTNSILESWFIKLNFMPTYLKYNYFLHFE